jgi:3-dehydroquinate synthase
LDIKIPVDVPGQAKRKYDVSIGSGVAARLGRIITAVIPDGRLTVITNRQVWDIVGDPIDTSLREAGLVFDLIEIPEGEVSKTPETVTAVYEAMTEFGARRIDPVVAVGGGVIGDLAGFAASTYMRGVSFFNVPTTLLSQVDSSIGGKTGVDLPAGKNLVGTFYQPAAVISDIDFLSSLPDREIKCGLAEVIKAALLAGGEFLDFMEGNIDSLVRREPASLTEAVALSVRFKAEIITSDEMDLNGRRAILNYGHTYGHALEAVTEFTGISHGEAVAEGMRFSARLSDKLGLAGPKITEKTNQLLNRAGFAPDMTFVNADNLIAAMNMDKKKTTNEITFILMEDFGRPVIEMVGPDTIISLVKEMIR